MSWFGAVQAQEFGYAKWGLGLRLPPGATDAQVHRAFDAGRILRTHILRPTWHFVTPADIGWMLALSAAGLERRMAIYRRRMGLDAAIFSKAAKLCERTLRDRNFLTRKELGAHFERVGLPGRSYLFAHIMMLAEQEGLVCSGPRRGKHSTYALLAERAPTKGAVRLSRDEGLAALARRYFQSHGPATLRDFVWWSGLTTAEAKRGLDMIPARELNVEGRSYWTLGKSGRSSRVGARLLPVYDEYLVAYHDRDVVPQGPAMVPARVAGYVQFQHALLVNGQVAGTWRPATQGDKVEIRVAPVRHLTQTEGRAIQREVVRYQRFLRPARNRPTRV